MEINNAVGNKGLIEHHEKVRKIHESTALERVATKI